MKKNNITFGLKYTIKLKKVSNGYIYQSKLVKNNDKKNAIERFSGSFSSKQKAYEAMEKNYLLDFKDNLILCHFELSKKTKAY